LLHARHAVDRPPGFDSFANEKWKNEIVRAEFGFADEIAQGRSSTQTTGALEQFSHRFEATRGYFAGQAL
jgi:hypothetical protein